MIVGEKAKGEEMNREEGEGEEGEVGGKVERLGGKER